jgi:hypothetical protein
MCNCACKEGQNQNKGHETVHEHLCVVDRENNARQIFVFDTVDTKTRISACECSTVLAAARRHVESAQRR